jgi:hypothetical protein
MSAIQLRRLSIPCCAALLVVFSQGLAAATLCVNPSGKGGCYTKIQSAVNAASANDVINVAPGTYTEDVTIGKPLSLIGAGAQKTIIDAGKLANGVLVDGYDNPGLRHVTVAGFTVQHAQFEGIVVVSASDVIVKDNHVVNNDVFPAVFNPNAPTPCPGQPAYETDESGDCGGAIHLIGTTNSIVSGNYISGNADGLLISDESAESRGNLVIQNTFVNNPLECGIVLASHPPLTTPVPPFAKHYGVDNNTIEENISSANGVQVGGSGVGLFSDGAGQGRVSGNLILHNVLTGNGIGGVSLHTHVGPAYGFPADDMSGNQIIGNYIAGNLADCCDTATPGRVGININSGGGGSPVWGTVISQNVIRDEDVDVAVNTPAELDLHLNDLLGGKIGVADVCAYDNGAGARVCTGQINATENYWGCPAGPGGHACSTVSGSDIVFTPWLHNPNTDGQNSLGDHPGQP